MEKPLDSFNKYRKFLLSSQETMEISFLGQCKGFIFCFLGYSVGRHIFELIACETNLKKKRCVRLFKKRVDFRKFQDFCSSELETYEVFNGVVVGFGPK